MILQQRATTEEQIAFDEEEREGRLARAKVGLVLGIILMPAGGFLDWIFYPESLGSLVLVRFLTALVLAIGLYIFYRFDLGRALPLVSTTLVLIPAWALAYLIYRTNGVESLYGFALIILMILMQLLGFTAAESALYCGLTTLSYILAVTLHPKFNDDGMSRLVFATTILGMSGIVCVAACYIDYRRRFANFLLRRSLNESNKQLDEKNRQLSELDRMRMTFLAEVSHELRTPLSTLLAPLHEILKANILPQDVGETFAIACRSGERLRVLVNDLLDIVRLEQATFRLDLEEVDARDLVSTVVASLRSFAAGSGVALRSNLATTPVQLSIDIYRFERVLQNIIGNALKFSPQGGTVTVSLRHIADHAIIAVQDEGPGVPMEEQEKIFERFYQSQHTQKRAAQGLGLGLAIARDIARWHHGDITVSNAPARGAIFEIKIPIASNSSDRDVVRNSKQTFAIGDQQKLGLLFNSTSSAGTDDSSSPKQDPLHEPLRASIGQASISKRIAEAMSEYQSDEPLDVLVVDDEPDLRNLLVSALSEKLQVRAVANGTDAVQRARQWKPRCILLDFMLPDENGLDVISTIRKTPTLNDSRIIMLTAHFDENLKIEALNRGADDFLVKPFGMTEVRARVASLARRSKLETELRREREELEISLKKLHAAEVQLVQSEKMRAVGSLAAGLLHEINNPVNYTLMAIKALRQDLASGRNVAEVVDDIQGGVQRISDIITDLRTFAYPDQQVVFNDFPLAAAIATAVRFTANQCQKINVLWDQSCFDGIMVHGSKSQVIQILVNLISNSANALAKQIPDRKPEIHIEHTRIPDHRVTIIVRDNGPGMSEEIVKRVCEPFFTTAQPGDGMGLGLSICETIVKSHGGRMKIESQLGQGTSVSFDLLLVSPSRKSSS